MKDVFKFVLVAWIFTLLILASLGPLWAVMLIVWYLLNR